MDSTSKAVSSSQNTNQLYAFFYKEFVDPLIFSNVCFLSASSSVTLLLYEECKGHQVLISARFSYFSSSLHAIQSTQILSLLISM